MSRISSEPSTTTTRPIPSSIKPQKLPTITTVATLSFPGFQNKGFFFLRASATFAAWSLTYGHLLDSSSNSSVDLRRRRRRRIESASLLPPLNCSLLFTCILSKNDTTAAATERDRAMRGLSCAVAIAVVRLQVHTKKSFRVRARAHAKKTQQTYSEHKRTYCSPGGDGGAVVVLIRWLPPLELLQPTTILMQPPAQPKR